MALQTFRGTFFQMQYPGLWDSEIIEDIPCFFDPDSGWALQAIAFRSQLGEPFTELNRYLERHSLKADPAKTAHFSLPSGLSCMACEFYIEQRFWLVNLIFRDNRMLFILFNSDELPEESLAREISSVIRTVEFI